MEHVAKWKKTICDLDFLPLVMCDIILDYISEPSESKLKRTHFCKTCALITCPKLQGKCEAYKCKTKIHISCVKNCCFCQVQIKNCKNHQHHLSASEMVCDQCWHLWTSCCLCSNIYGSPDHMLSCAECSLQVCEKCGNCCLFCEAWICKECICPCRLRTKKRKMHES